MFATVDRH